MKILINYLDELFPKVTVSLMFMGPLKQKLGYEFQISFTLPLSYPLGELYESAMRAQ